MIQNLIIVTNVSNSDHNSTIASDLTKLFNGLFPAWPTVLATILAVTILLVVLTKYVWKPIKKAVKERHNYIQSNIDASNLQKTIATNDRKQALQELDRARLEANDIIVKAKFNANKKHDEIVDAAHKQSKHLLNEMNKEVIREKTRLKTEAHDEIVSVALAAAKKIIDKDVDNKVNKKIIEDYIKQNEE